MLFSSLYSSDTNLIKNISCSKIICLYMENVVEKCTNLQSVLHIACLKTDITEILN